MGKVVLGDGGGPSRITNVYKEEAKRVRVRRRWNDRAEVGVMCFEYRGRGHELRNAGSL